ncbi:hypothetical protein M514_09972 [Trichuris suis]|uniref:Uncharacterized protein n=1 Tax=Trichuris suis TaxID=68888 RepID=A0A085MY86_9BILA|nr:hypothetical protein M513_09972 [Trichuris suis]KFD62182.1 hypothetical protein M514_09972 [Trichuris suis]
MLRRDFTARFEDIFGMKTPSWMVDPFRNCERRGRGLTLQEVLIELQTNEVLNPTFKSNYQIFWMQGKVADLYATLGCHDFVGAMGLSCAATLHMTTKQVDNSFTIPNVPEVFSFGCLKLVYISDAAMKKAN